jgi:hypothetical protein
MAEEKSFGNEEKLACPLDFNFQGKVNIFKFKLEDNEAWQKRRGISGILQNSIVTGNSSVKGCVIPRFFRLEIGKAWSSDETRIKNSSRSY